MAWITKEIEDRLHVKRDHWQCFVFLSPDGVVVPFESSLDYPVNLLVGLIARDVVSGT